MHNKKLFTFHIWSFQKEDEVEVGGINLTPLDDTQNMPFVCIKSMQSFIHETPETY